MTIFESIMTGAFLLSFVFFVLALLFVLIKVLSAILIAINTKVSAPKAATVTIEAKPVTETAADGDYAYGGELRLIDVDDATAAMIMAIVSDESGIPLPQLCFRSIKALPNKNTTQGN